MSDVVKRILTPVRLAYRVGAGRDKSRFLEALVEGRFVGQRCPRCHKVYVPPRGCPTCGVATTDIVDVSDVGTVTTFCIVNIPIEGRTAKLPYVYASIVLDGADLPLFHLVDGIDAQDVGMGLRVRADWLPAAERTPTLECIRSFRPAGEPTAPFASFEGHL